MIDKHQAHLLKEQTDILADGFTLREKWRCDVWKAGVE